MPTRRGTQPQDLRGLSRLLLGVPGFTWCEALSLGVPKPSGPLRDNLWSDLSFSGPFRNCGSVPSVSSRIWLPYLSARVPLKPWTPTLHTRMRRNSSNNDDEIGPIRPQARGMPTRRGTQPQDLRGLRGFFWGFLASHGAKHSPSESRSHQGCFATICGLTCHFWVLSGIAGLFPVCPPGSGFRICQPGFP